MLLGVMTGCGVVGCGVCSGNCSALTADILETNGYVVISATSSCSNVAFFTPNATSVSAFALSSPATCHFDVTLDDGETISLDVPFTKVAQWCCCNGCNNMSTADSTPLTISAPPGYVPHVDGGVDAARDAAFDGAGEDLDVSADTPSSDSPSDGLMADGPDGG